jgi:hypothetical protein
MEDQLNAFDMLFRFADGHTEHGPRSAEHNDEISILPRVPSPFVQRQVLGVGATHGFVGRCHVHGQLQSEIQGHGRTTEAAAGNDVTICWVNLEEPVFMSYHHE